MDAYDAFEHTQNPYGPREIYQPFTRSSSVTSYSLSSSTLSATSTHEDPMPERYRRDFQSPPFLTPSPYHTEEMYTEAPTQSAQDFGQNSLGRFSYYRGGQSPCAKTRLTKTPRPPRVLGLRSPRPHFAACFSENPKSRILPPLAPNTRFDQEAAQLRELAANHDLHASQIGSPMWMPIRRVEHESDEELLDILHDIHDIGLWQEEREQVVLKGFPNQPVERVDSAFDHRQPLDNSVLIIHNCMDRVVDFFATRTYTTRLNLEIPRGGISPHDPTVAKATSDGIIDEDSLGFIQRVQYLRLEVTVGHGVCPFEVLDRIFQQLDRFREAVGRTQLKRVKIEVKSRDTRQQWLWLFIQREMIDAGIEQGVEVEAKLFIPSEGGDAWTEVLTPYGNI